MTDANGKISLWLFKPYTVMLPPARKHPKYFKIGLGEPKTGKSNSDSDKD